MFAKKVTLNRLKQCVHFGGLRALSIVFVVCFAGLMTGCKTPSHAPATKTALKTRNVVLITTDGLRWQEVFGGADDVLLTNASLTANPDRMKLVFGKPTPEARRSYLMPFLWSEIAAHGQIYGNRLKGSESRVTNGKNFSYPGYNEFLTGAPDPRIDSNDPKVNPNTNVFEWLNNQPEFRGKVAAVVNWSTLPWILNTPRSQIPVWTGYARPPGTPPFHAPEMVEDILADMTPVLGGVAFDSFIAHVALDYLKRKKPRAFYVAFMETDSWAHKGEYDRDLVATSHVDWFIRDLWDLCQSLPEYRDKTTFIITTDHGRGNGPLEWKSHSATIAGSDSTWMAVIGPDTPPLGERVNCRPVTASQIAATIAAFLGKDFSEANPHAAPPVDEMFGGADMPKQDSFHDHSTHP